jgi:MFS family permease
MERAAKNTTRRKGSLYDQQIIYPRQLPWILRRHIYTGAMGTIYAWSISGVFLVPLAILVGVTDSLWAYLNGLALLAACAQVFSAHLTETVGKRKFIWYLNAFLGRFSRFTAIVLAFLFGYVWGDLLLGAIVFFVFVVLASLFEAIALPPWMSWLKDLVPSGTHATFMGRRSVWISLFTIMIFVPIGYALDKVPEASQPYGLLAVLVFGCLVGLLDLIIHRTIPEPPLRDRPEDIPLVPKILEPFRHRKFRRWMLFVGAWNMAMYIGGATGFMYFVRGLEVHKNYFLATLVLIVLPLVGPALTAGRVGRLVDRVGVRLPLGVCHLLWAFLPFFWVFATKQTAFVWLALSSFVGGLSSTSVANIASKVNTRSAPSGKQAMFIAAVTFFSYLAGALGAFIGGRLLSILGNDAPSYHTIFIISGTLRLLSVLLIPFIPEPPRALRQ